MPSSTSKGSSPPLQRGRACSNCRRRKIRCDGQRPICGPCTRTSKSADDCEYTDSGRSRTQLLEANIARLEARVRELESPEYNRPPLALVAPYDEHQQSPPSILLSSGNSPKLSSPYPPFSHLESQGSTTPPSIASSVDSAQEEPPSIVVKMLLQSFFPHASEFGFFLDFNRFYDEAIRPLPIGHHGRPSSALLSAVYLWGVHLSNSEEFTTHEHVFLSRALQHSASNLSSNHPSKIMHGLQAEVLLCMYFFRAGRFLEGTYHFSAAISMITSTELHKIRSVSSRSYNPPSEGTTTLLPPKDATEEGERITAFWTVYSLHNCWSAALGSLMTLSFEARGAHIDTPWPLDMDQYEQRLPPELQGSFTVRNFLNNIPESSFGEFSTLAMYSKASILFEQAASKTAQCHPNMEPDEATRFTESFAALDDCIDRFVTALPPIMQLEMTLPTVIRTIFVTHTLAHAASLRLHAIFADTNEHSRRKCLSSAMAIIGLAKDVDLQSFQYINPIIGSLWMSACQFLIDEMLRSRTLRSIWAPESIPDEKESQMISALERGFGAMAMFSLECPLISYQLTKVQESYSHLN